MIAGLSIKAKVTLVLLAFGLVSVVLNGWHTADSILRRESELLREEAESQGTQMAGMMQHCFRSDRRRAAELQVTYSAMAPGLVAAAVVDEANVIRYSTRLDWVGVQLAESPLAPQVPQAEQARAVMTGIVESGAEEGSGIVLAAHPFFTRYDSAARGVVLQRYDASAVLRDARAEALRVCVIQTGVLVALCGLLWVALDLLVTDRVRRMLDQARESGEGGPARAALSGQDELAQVSQEFAGAVARARETEARMLEATEQERRRIGRDLHDDVCQRIAATQLMTGVLSRALAEEGSGQVALAESLLAEQNDTANAVRAVAQGLAPVRVEREGLAPALEIVTAQIAKSFGVRCDVECSLGTRAPAIWVLTHIFRIVQELATNAAKHAGASWIRCSVRAEEGLLRVAVESDGVPFGGPPPGGRGLGLHFLQQRVRALGGILRFTPKCGVEGDGTLALCVIRLCDIHYQESKEMIP